MRRWTTGLLAGLLLVLAGWVLAPAASACGCTGGTTSEHALRADAVFAGRLVDREVIGGTALHVFAVDTVYTGAVSARQGVLSPSSGASCGLELSGEGPFLVFAAHEDGRLAADLCGGTAAWTPGAAAEVQMLTGATAPEPGSAGTELPGGPSGTTLEAAVAVLLVAVFAGGLLLRRRAAG
ncbi:hypothetical protein [Geodermatophilus poikilotrophus]|uniref:Tissue inhibitor of metalloproteinase n=1 Tax=Geodermatophilus poikilotrophus TaxID=1333667 RepID=A0A1I0HVZ1_9ACTN|nr:hypothetical protein [Geodermatophilus poikilotrophus]SET87376.1 hypothetical protein SAMN04488546_4009 [Geodermatophilus poikilotrophus]